jgi:hypothetical protein
MTDVNDPEALSRAEQHFGLQSLVDIDELVRPRGEENVYGAVRRVVRERDEALEHLKTMHACVWGGAAWQGTECGRVEAFLAKHQTEEEGTR